MTQLIILINCTKFSKKISNKFSQIMVYAKWGIVISRSWERSRSETYEKLELLWSPILYISLHEVFEKYLKMMQMQGMAGGWTKRWNIDEYKFTGVWKIYAKIDTPQLTLTWHFFHFRNTHRNVDKWWFMNTVKILIFWCCC